MGRENSTLNGGQVVCTAGGTQVAIAPIDPCWDEGRGEVGLPDNWADKRHVTTAGGATTRRTTINGFEIMTVSSHLGPSAGTPTFNAHEFTGGGVVSGTHHHDAVATSYSADWFSEGQPCVRHFDSTMHNTGNAAGLMTPDAQTARIYKQMALDACGLADPTPICDALSAKMALEDGDYLGAGLSGLSMLPYLGDAIAKPLKAGRYAKRLAALRQAGKLGDAKLLVGSADAFSRRVVGVVDDLDFATPPGRGAVYSGTSPTGLRSREQALSFAQDYDVVPIDLTPGGQYLESLNLFETVGPDNANRIWSAASEQYARGLSGAVVEFTEHANPARVFATVERPIIDASDKAFRVLPVAPKK